MKRGGEETTIRHGKRRVLRDVAPPIDPVEKR